MPSGTSQQSLTTTTPTSPLPHSRLARSHNRRFHGRFPEVESEEHLLDYYSCALLADILLQGHLYITENFFAFYSNIFGRKTQILIPTCEVVNITKERTAKIIPNAVGVYTDDTKYVFGSLLSRNSTYRLMQYVWMKSADPELYLHDDSESDNTSLLLQNGTEDEESASDNSEPGSSDELHPAPRPEDLPATVPPSRRMSRRLSEYPRAPVRPIRRPSNPPSTVLGQLRNRCNWGCAKGKECITKVEEAVSGISRLPRTTLLLLVSTVLLVGLFMCATFLVYRVTVLYHMMPTEESLHSIPNIRSSSYLEQLRRHQWAVEEEMRRVSSNLRIRVDQLGKVRQSIERLIAFGTRESCKNIREHAPPCD